MSTRDKRFTAEIDAGITDAQIEWREQLGQRLMLAMTCQHGSDYFGSGAVCETCFANVQRIGHLIERIAAQAWDQGRAAERRDWEFTADLSTPDEDRQPLPNPYRVTVRPPRRPDDDHRAAGEGGRGAVGAYDVHISGVVRPACKCGWVADREWLSVDVYDAHVATALSPLLDEFAAQDYAAGAASVIAYPEQALAEAWDEGFDAGERDVFEHEHQERGFDTPCIANPYRTPQTRATAPLAASQPERDPSGRLDVTSGQGGDE